METDPRQTAQEIVISRLHCREQQRRNRQRSHHQRNQRLDLTASATATFAFSATEPGSTFDCRLDGGEYAPCTSPQGYASLALGSHVFEVRAIDAAGNVDPTPATCTWERGFSLAVTFAGTGGGTVNGDDGWQPVTGTGTQVLPLNSEIILSALANNVSTFDGWGGECTGYGACTLTMAADKGVTALFTRSPNAVIGAVGYLTLREAYLAAEIGATIMALDTVLPESLTVNKQLILKGGYTADYRGRSGNQTVLKGALTIGTGSLIVDALAVN